MFSIDHLKHMSIERINLKTNLVSHSYIYTSHKKSICGYYRLAVNYMTKLVNSLNIDPHIRSNILAIECAFKVTSCTPNKLKLNKINSSIRYYMVDMYKCANGSVINPFILPTDLTLSEDYIDAYISINISELTKKYNVAYIRMVKMNDNFIIHVSRTYHDKYNINEQYINDIIDNGLDMYDDIIANHSKHYSFWKFINEFQSLIPYTDRMYVNKRAIIKDLVYKRNNDAYNDIIVNNLADNNSDCIAYGKFMNFNIISHHSIPLTFVMHKEPKVYYYKPEDVINIKEVCRVIDDKVALCNKRITNHIRDIYNHNSINKHLSFKECMRLYVAYHILHIGWMTNRDCHKESILCIRKMISWHDVIDSDDEAAGITIEDDAIFIPIPDHNSFGDISTRTIIELRQELNEKNAELAKKDAEISKLTDKILELTHEVVNNRNDELKRKYDELTVKYEELRQENEELRQENAELRRENEELKRKNEELSDRLTILEEKYDKVLALLEAHNLTVQG